MDWIGWISGVYRAITPVGEVYWKLVKIVWFMFCVKVLGGTVEKLW